MKYVKKAVKKYFPHLYYRALEAMRELRIRRRDFKPLHIMAEVTTHCNLSCRWCGNKRMKIKKGFMSKELYKKIIDQSSAMGIPDISLHTIGEPLLHPEIIEFIKIAKSAKMNTILTSNALLLDAAASGNLIASGLDHIRFSVEGTDKPSYERLRCGSNFEKVIENLSFFKKERDGRGASPRITINSVMMKSLLNSANDFYKLWGKFADEICFMPIGNLNQFSREEMEREVLRKEDPLKRKPCAMLWETMIVQWDGKVTACCMDFDNELIIGDIQKNTLGEIWSSKAYNTLRQKHLLRNFDEFPICKRCDAGNRSSAYEIFRLNRRMNRQAKS